MDGNYNGKPKASYDLTNKGIEKHHGSINDLLTDKIFGYMTASLNTNLFSKVERKNICTSFSNVKITKETLGNGIETITGTYKDIEKIYQCFQDLHLRKQEGREYLPSRLNGSLEFEKNELSVSVSSAQYEYFNHVCLQKIEELKQRFHVRIDCSNNSDDMSSLHFIALHDGGQVEKAHQSYVYLFQKTMVDWSQEVIELTDRNHLDYVAKMLNEKYKQILTKKTTNSLILRGPKQELLEVKKSLKSMKKEQVVKPVDFAIQTHKRTNGVEVDLNQFQLCRDLMEKDIKEIEQKYLVSKQLRNTHGPKVYIIFTPIKTDLDLSEHAYEHFIFSFQRAVSNVSKKIINLKDFHPTGKLSSLIDFLANRFCDLSFQIVDDTLIIAGLLPRVMDAEKEVHFLLKRDLSHLRNVPIDLNSKKKYSSLTRENSSPFKKSEAVAIEEQQATCPICLEIPRKKKILDKCKHEFCEQCLNTAMLHKPVCPVCNTPYGIVIGDQPDGRMDHYCTPDKLPGYHCGTIVIDYSIPDGIQGAKHPNPGQRFQGAHRRAYLPNNDEGQNILHLLKKAFNQKLIFTIGQSRTTGTSNIVTWNDIHHKTSMHGGPQRKPSVSE
ncbi:E3 ubiquitin-protein ligase DTX3L isoform X2 [Lissotriton helveticus]